jgi:prepilin-type processing-associated H-X9-DG protein
MVSNREADISVRHDRGREYGAMQPDYSPEGRGNAAFVDGHCDLVERLPARSPPHTDPRYGR